MLGRLAQFPAGDERYPVADRVEAISLAALGKEAETTPGAHRAHLSQALASNAQGEKAEPIRLDGVIAVQVSANPAPSCVGDCDSSGAVSIDEILTGVTNAIGDADVTRCVPFDADRSGNVTADELIRGEQRAESGCP